MVECKSKISIRELILINNCSFNNTVQIYDILYHMHFYYYYFQLITQISGYRHQIYKKVAWIRSTDLIWFTARPFVIIPKEEF